MKKNTPTAKSITFRDGRDKDRIDEILAGIRMRNLMPDKVKGKCAPMVLWALEYMNRLVEKGTIRMQAAMFADTPAEVEALQAENDRLRKRVRQLEQQQAKSHAKKWWQIWK